MTEHSIARDLRPAGQGPPNRSRAGTPDRATDDLEYPRWAAIRRSLGFKNISALYIFVLIFIVFSIWVPDTFLTVGVWRALLDAQTITALAAIAATIPTITGAFNLAVGAEVGFASILVAAFIAKQDMPVAPAVVLTLLSGALIGLATGVIIAKTRIDSLIATLGTSSILIAGTAWVSGSKQILDLGSGFRELAGREIFTIPMPAYFVLAVGLISWYVLEMTPVGRRMYATGFNAEAARLAGVSTIRIQVASLMAGSTVAALAGILLCSRITVGDPTVGPSLLLPAFAAVFLGSTQFRGGRFNIWGTVVAVYVLAVGVKGLQLAGMPIWITDLFNGVALLLAVGLSKWERTARRSGAVGRLLSRYSRQDETGQSTPQI